MHQLNSDILDIFNCPGCSHYMTTTIYNCPDGHNFCQSCWSKRRNCPVCHVLLNDTRNYSMESIGKIISYPCENVNLGCTELLQAGELQEHSQSCSMRKYNCRLDDSCHWTGLHTELKQHAILKHNSQVWIGEKRNCMWTLSMPQQAVYLMVAHEERFFVWRKLRGDVMYWALQYVGQAQDIILYYFEFLTDQYQNRRIVASELCQSDINEDITEIIESGFCIAVPLNTLETYINTDGAVLYRVKIKIA